MPYAVELFFDPAAEAQVADLWRAMAAAGLPTLSFAHGHRPHISLGVAGAIDKPVLGAALALLAAQTEPLELSLASVGAFPTREGVVFLAPVVDEALLRLHARWHALLRQHMTDANAYYAPGRWVPHCSVAYHVPHGALGRAVEVALGAALPLRAVITQAGLLRVSPEGTELLACVPLAGGAGPLSGDSAGFGLY